MSPLKPAKTLDKNALVNIFDHYSEPLYNYVFCICSDSFKADYIVGNVFASFLNQLSSGSGSIADMRSYLYKTTYQLIASEPEERVQRKTHKVRSFSGSQADLSLTPLAYWTDLTNEQKHVIFLRFLEGLSRFDTAFIMGKEIEQVKVIEYGAIETLLKKIDPFGMDETIPPSLAS